MRPAEITIDRVELGVEAARLPAMAEFYEERVGLPVAREPGSLTIGLPVGELRFHAVAFAPWYHFALLLPGNRFDAALAWATRHVPLEHGDDGPAVDFPAWDARALYFQDPVGNPVEMIAHRGCHETSEAGSFDPGELRGISEIAVVSDDLSETARQLDAVAGLEHWDGSTEAGIIFVGRRAHTFVLSRTGRRLLFGDVGVPYPLAVELTSDSGRGERVRVGLADGNVTAEPLWPPSGSYDE